MPELPVWTCDTCGEPIKSVNDGWVEWIEFDRGDGRRAARNLRLVHHQPASPRAPDGSCQFNERAQYARDHGIVCDLSLDEFVGTDGLISLLEMVSEGRHPTEEVLTLIQRLHVPGYEQARHHFAAAISEGIFEPNTKPGYYTTSDIQKVLDWIRTRKP
jgi:hypothetical protein